jgi:hypothetical protein
VNGRKQRQAKHGIGEEAVHDQCRSGLVGFFSGRAELADQSANLKRQEERGYRRREMHEYADQLCVLNKGQLQMNRSVFDHRISSNTVLGLTPFTTVHVRT